MTTPMFVTSTVSSFLGHRRSAQMDEFEEEKKRNNVA